MPVLSLRCLVPAFLVVRHWPRPEQMGIQQGVSPSCTFATSFGIRVRGHQALVFVFAGMADLNLVCSSFARRTASTGVRPAR
eukprot:826032-Rhodomonas_salina.1